MNRRLHLLALGRQGFSMKNRIIHSSCPGGISVTVCQCWGHCFFCFLINWSREHLRGAGDSVDGSSGVLRVNWRDLGSLRIVEAWRCRDLQSWCIARLGTWEGPSCISVGGDGSVHERKAGDVVAGLFTKYCAHSSVENLSSFNSAALNIWVADKQEHSLFPSQNWALCWLCHPLHRDAPADFPLVFICAANGSIFLINAGRIMFN